MEQFIDKNLTINEKYNLDNIIKNEKIKKLLGLEISIKNGNIKYIIFGEQKKRRINNTLKLFKDIAKKYPQINTKCLIRLDDWGSHERLKDYPIFVFSKWIKENKNIVIPDYLFCEDYNITKRTKGSSYNKLINEYKNKYKFEEKNEIAFMRAGTSKNKILINMFKNIEKTDVQWSKNNFLTYDQIFQHKYAIIHYMRWDTIYMIFKGGFLPFLYMGYRNYLWYDLFLEDNKHYISFESKEQYIQKRKNIEYNQEKQKIIIKELQETSDKYFKYDIAVQYMGELLLKYQEYII